MRRLREAVRTLDEGQELLGEYGGFQMRDGAPVVTILRNSWKIALPRSMIKVLRRLKYGDCVGIFRTDDDVNSIRLRRIGRGI
jgi:hypothetical protein